ncbi:helix-turn-helix domain-containing protein [Halonotius roseus]|uniref:Helix-turn-helix domain-containing protein n=1 Tax=Halonotius roseus TaxID=2511997 RepID=A0A544QMI7_9EURY|nr:helix-turn-helix domain-containing protein [Halonotius roseus]TQQ80094.1 helix-turn-helix domain-containing protein [Halonotius roseus]
MTEARLTVTLPEAVWIGDVSTTHPDTTFTVLTAVPDEDVGFGLVRLTGPDIEAVLEDIEGYDQITELSVLQQADAQATIQFRTTMPLVQLSARASGMPIEFPMEIRGGEATVDVTGPHERLSELVTQLRNFDLPFDVEYVQERLHTSQLLSETQRELVLKAVELGYYDTPRECSLTDVADAAGTAKSTCSETLHRAEESIIKHFVDDIPTPIESDQRISAPE